MPEESVIKEQELLIRLVKCMNGQEILDITEEAIKILGERCSFYANFEMLQPESIQAELEITDIGDRMMATWPGNWPGRRIVDLDNLDDPGAWLEKHLPESVFECLFGNVDWEQLAEYLGEEYYNYARDKGLEMPGDMTDDPSLFGPQDDKRTIKQDFLGFLWNWREQIIETLEKQNQTDNEGGQ
jgi:hypothetical protein